MIALATWCAPSKITTPNEAGTSLGVSPISSNRNVMVKVKDTLSFINAAIAAQEQLFSAAKKLGYENAKGLATESTPRTARTKGQMSQDAFIAMCKRVASWNG